MSLSEISSKNQLWQFIDDKGSFRLVSPESTGRLYFPLANTAGIFSSITPQLQGDIKTGHNEFLTLPISIEDLPFLKANRNFWLKIENKGPYSITGASALQQAGRLAGLAPEQVTLEAGMLWHKVIRVNSDWGVKSEIVNFIPASPHTVEIMKITITNTGKSRLRFTPTSAVPIFGRSADNLRDHRHVTSLLQRIASHAYGVVVKPTMSFDERGHKVNEKMYCVLGTGGSGEAPIGSFSTIQEFVGEAGNFWSPQAVVEDRPLPEKNGVLQGKAAMGALRFKPQSLAPGEKVHYVLLLGIASKEAELDDWVKRFGSIDKAELALKETKAFWSQKAEAVRFFTANRQMDLWLRWVGIQPHLRKIFGNSFLPDFDYGRGGRGWRDLWQDALALLLTSPAETREMLIHNFGGVRIDGSNATVIRGDNHEFVADRNNITRVWMDHGVWPYITLELYLHLTGDFAVLDHQAPYFRDVQLSRGRRKDFAWTEACGRRLKTRRGRPVTGSVLEHLLVQHLVQFYNVGEHNHIRLENADWNDGLDMASERGESVAFTALYASNLRSLADVLETRQAGRKIKTVRLAKELLLLLDRAGGRRIDYGSIAARRRRLEKYFAAVEPTVSGTQATVRVDRLVQDLRAKADFLAENVRQKEWIQTREGDCLYNGYYDNLGRRVEGDSPKGVHMTLPGQVFPILGGVATRPQVAEIYKTARKYLRDREQGGYRLNTDFHQIRPDLGRAFSFAYGEKENGAFFSHMSVMFANALYSRGFVNEGREVLESIARMCLRTDKSRIYPGLPEYFNSEGRGMYHYLTGSASWLVLTMLTQVYGVRGRFGDLVLEPKLTHNDFGPVNELSAETVFAGRRVRVTYRNLKKIPYEHYCITRITVNGKELKDVELNRKEARIPRDLFLKIARKPLNLLVISLE